MTTGKHASFFWEDFYFYKMGYFQISPSYENVNVTEVGKQGPEQCVQNIFFSSVF